MPPYILYILFGSGGAKPTFATLGFIQTFAEFKSRLGYGHNSDLGNALSLFNGTVLLAVVVQGHHNFSSVITINYANLVGGGQIPFAGKAASGEN